MPKRNLILTTGEAYHIYNRSVGRELIFDLKRALNKALEIINFYRFPQTVRLSQFNILPDKIKQSYQAFYLSKPPLVEIYCFALMPNHYHFLLKQLSDKGISKFISNFQNSFAKVYNLKNDRHGTLFQNPFKAKRIETNEQYLHVSRYIHLNPVTSYLIEYKDLKTYPWTSFPDYIGQAEQNPILETKPLIKLIGSKEKYRDFVAYQVDYQRDLALIKGLILD